MQPSGHASGSRLTPRFFLFLSLNAAGIALYNTALVLCPRFITGAECAPALDLLVGAFSELSRNLLSLGAECALVLLGETVLGPVWVRQVPRTCGCPLSSRLHPPFRLSHPHAHWAFMAVRHLLPVSGGGDAQGLARPLPLPPLRVCGTVYLALPTYPTPYLTPSCVWRGLPHPTSTSPSAGLLCLWRRARPLHRVRRRPPPPHAARARGGGGTSLARSPSLHSLPPSLPPFPPSLHSLLISWSSSLGSTHVISRPFSLSRAKRWRACARPLWPPTAPPAATASTAPRAASSSGRPTQGRTSPRRSAAEARSTSRPAPSRPRPSSSPPRSASRCCPTERYREAACRSGGQRAGEGSSESDPVEIERNRAGEQRLVRNTIVDKQAKFRVAVYFK